MSSCVAIEKQTALWKEHDYMETRIYKSFPIKSTLLMHVNGTICIFGAAASNLVYWIPPPREDLPFGDGTTNPDYIGSEDHGSLIHDLTAINNTIYSCASDTTVKSWMLTNTGLVRQITYKTTMLSAAKCISSCPERALFATGSFSGIIYVFDSRSSNKPISRYHPHTEEVTDLAMNTEYILSVSSDQTVSVWDQRAGRTMKSITIPSYEYTFYISMRQDWVCVADAAAKLHMLNPKNDFELVKSYSTEHSRTRGPFENISGLHLSHGSLITSFKDTVEISCPTDPPKLITTLRPKFHRINSMDYLNDTLAVSGDFNIAIWRPKSTG
ncbi:F-box/WD repeat-containing protein 9-like [Temnothorax nylanderi]|uniref:F-box/WD repeat-containing protein 9-like n=1 Tax=Temnothorax nylanderi TaxID=102681 RepID=UPI003A848F1B